MKKKILEIIYLTEEEELELFLIKDSYEKNGYRCVVEKVLIEDETSEYTMFLAFSKTEE